VFVISWDDNIIYYYRCSLTNPSSVTTTSLAAARQTLYIYLIIITNVGNFLLNYIGPQIIVVKGSKYLNTRLRTPTLFKYAFVLYYTSSRIRALTIIFHCENIIVIIYDGVKNTHIIVL